MRRPAPVAAGARRRRRRWGSRSRAGGAAWALLRLWGPGRSHAPTMPVFRVLVTGGNGCLGRFAVAALQRRGFEAITVARSGGDVRIGLTQAGPRRELLTAIAPAA